MAENKNTGIGDLEKLALIAESVQSIYKGKATVVFELEGEEYKSVINRFLIIRFFIRLTFLEFFIKCLAYFPSIIITD